MSKKLVVFDVDFTLCQGLLDEALFCAMSHDIKQVQFEKGFSGKQTWIQIINRAISIYPPLPQQINNYLLQVPMVNGMKQTLNILKKQSDLAIAILSCGNTLLIQKYLQINQCLHYFDYIFGASLNYDNNSHTYTYEYVKEKCELPTCNLCKMKAFKFEQFSQKFQKVVYIGDGLNDLCGMSIIKTGCVFIRKQKKLDQQSQKNKNILSTIKVDKKFWKDGFDLIHQISQ